MVIWGAIWGVLRGFLWPGHDSDAQAAIGAIGGLMAGYGLRRMVRAEIAWEDLPAARIRAVAQSSAAPGDGFLDQLAARLGGPRSVLGSALVAGALRLAGVGVVLLRQPKAARPQA